MASAENDETNPKDETGRTTQPHEQQCSPPPKGLALSPSQEDDAPESLALISNQEIDTIDGQPEGIVLLPPPDHEPVPPNMVPPNQETDSVQWTESRRPLPSLIQPPSSLPAWRYTSPREHNPAARLPTAMAHRTRTPLPQSANARTPDATPMLTHYNKHGITTYSTESTEEIGLDPDDRDDRDVLRYTDKVPMAGRYLRTADYREGMKAQEDMLVEYGESDIRSALDAHVMQEGPPRVPGK
jgi:hypothetical protein